jgi:hypothetical protein
MMAVCLREGDGTGATTFVIISTIPETLKLEDRKSFRLMHSNPIANLSLLMSNGPGLRKLSLATMIYFACNNVGECTPKRLPAPALPLTTSPRVVCAASPRRCPRSVSARRPRLDSLAEGFLRQRRPGPAGRHYQSLAGCPDRALNPSLVKLPYPQPPIS